MLLATFLFKDLQHQGLRKPLPFGVYLNPKLKSLTCALQVLCMLLVTFLFKAFSIKAARGLHNSMLARLLRYARRVFRA